MIIQIKKKKQKQWMGWIFRENCCCSVAKWCPTLCNPMDCSTPGFPVLHYLPEFAQTHVHWAGDIIQPPHPLLPPSPPVLNLSHHQGLGSPELQADSLPSEPPGKPLELQRYFSKFSLKYLEMIFPESQNLIKILHTTLKNLQKKISFNKLFAATGLFL